MKLCINCAHYSYIMLHTCNKHVITKISPVTGNPRSSGWIRCEIERAGDRPESVNPCGPEGKNFEEKAKEFKPVKVSFWESFSMV